MCSRNLPIVMVIRDFAVTVVDNSWSELNHGRTRIEKGAVKRQSMTVRFGHNNSHFDIQDGQEHG